MKVLDTVSFTALLLVVPALAWIVGRAMGRRDWPVARVVAAGLGVTAVPAAVRFAFEAALAPPPYGVALRGLAIGSLDNLEVGLFLSALGVFMTMVGWTSTPVAANRPGGPRGTAAGG